MKIIARGTFEGTNADLRALIDGRVTAFRRALSDHAQTQGVPAPREDDLIEQLARSEEPFEVEPEQTAPVLSAEQIAAQELEVKRFEALRALDEQRLAVAAADPEAPQEVKDYAAVRAISPSDNPEA